MYYFKVSDTIGYKFAPAKGHFKARATSSRQQRLPHQQYFVIFLLLIIPLFISCNKKNNPPAFELLTAKTTGLHFANNLHATDSFNMFNYMYFYNGAGVGAGDFNNDGLTDLFFASNQSQNKMFLNTGNMTFKDITQKARIPQDSAWSTGVSVVDINNDGLLDIYICRVGRYENLLSENQLLVCTGLGKTGIPQYVDSARAYGLNFSGFSTQALFWDADNDGDLDMFLMNHSIHQNGTFAERKNFLGTFHPLSGDRFYRNHNGKYTDETPQSGINSSAIGYGLGICAGDVDMDGDADMYIGNDFHENDYLYINNRNGTFTESLDNSIMHTSQFSMGVDVADANNDGFPEIVSMDMLPKDPYILKRSLGEDAYDIFYYKIRSGYHHQYARNALQLNNGNGSFSEVGVYSGVHATDWSWAPLWMDFNNDGLKDLFVSNGIPKRLNDIDYVNYITDSEIQNKIKEHRMGEKEMTVINSFPEIKLPNQFFQNNGDMRFSDINGQITGGVNTFSNGAVYADLDNDGDLDIVVNNINDPVMVYRNTANDKREQPALTVQLTGSENNRNAIGAKLLLYMDNGAVRVYEKFPVRGFQSSMEIPLHAGLAGKRPDSAILVWPDNSYTRIT
ncbi:MAG: CRTAC1 family protein, partial [Dinghuibacter sp.]|nr:CRTAC1 family protein [Dinghuibacter sp.]